MAENGPSVAEAGKNSQEFVKIVENGKNQPRALNDVSQKYVKDLLSERSQLENNFPLAVKLIDEALERVHLNGGRTPAREQYADVYQQRTIKLSQKVHVPIKDKKFNYVGKLLGPKGNSLRRLQEETQCRIVILGRFSMKDRSREEELRNSADSKYAHLNLPLHVEVSTIAPPAEAYARVAYALAELRRYLMPDKHDDIRQEQFRELMGDPDSARKIRQQRQGNGGGGGANGNPRNNGGGSGGGGGYNGYRGKFPPHHPQQYHNGETGYYRSQDNSGHPPKLFRSAARVNNMHSTLVPAGMIGPPSGPAGMTVTTANYNGRSAGGLTAVGMMANNGLTGGGGGGGGGGIGGSSLPNTRYRSSLPQYQFAKKL